MNDAEVYLAGAVRTVHGKYGGSLRDVRMVDLGALAARNALQRSGLPTDAIGEVVLSNCRQAGNGPNPSRQVAFKAGIPEQVPAQTINMACASGLKAIATAHRSVADGDCDAALAVAAESMSTMPYLGSYRMRWQGLRRGNLELVDGWKDGGTDPICGLNMGQTAEKVARAFDISRADQDAWALRSHQRVRQAWDEDLFTAETVPVEHDGGTLEHDETFRANATAERLAALKPAFEADGAVTAGNASQMADGAAAVVVGSARAISEHSMWPPMGRLLSFAAVGVDPSMMGIGPTAAIPKALEQAGVKLDDVDLFEINEAFAAQIVQNVRELNLDPDKVNVHGGGIALGHPTGQSGCRVVVSLLHELARLDQRIGVVSLCVGGGQGVAAVIERVVA